MRVGDRTYRGRKIRMLRSDAGRGKVPRSLCTCGPQLYGQGGRPSLALLRRFHLANCTCASNPRDLAVWCAEGKGSENCSGKWAGPRAPTRSGEEGRECFYLYLKKRWNSRVLSPGAMAVLRRQRKGISWIHQTTNRQASAFISSGAPLLSQQHQGHKERIML